MAILDVGGAIKKNEVTKFFLVRIKKFIYYKSIMYKSVCFAGADGFANSIHTSLMFLF